jgi:hypothetical protein
VAFQGINPPNCFTVRPEIAPSRQIGRCGRLKAALKPFRLERHLRKCTAGAAAGEEAACAYDCMSYSECKRGTSSGRETPNGYARGGGQGRWSGG